MECGGKEENRSSVSTLQDGNKATLLLQDGIALISKAADLDNRGCYEECVTFYRLGINQLTLAKECMKLLEYI